MPELPEVETIKTGLQNLVGQKIRQIKVHNPSLRYMIAKNLEDEIKNKTILEISRRGKYLIFKMNHGFLIVHLGMSGSISLKGKSDSHNLLKHDHVEIFFNDYTMRYNDPRRFGAIIYTPNDSNYHFLINKLGPEPLTDTFTAKYLAEELKSRKSSIKQAIMDHHIVVGVGNIYACEALFLSQILPTRPANTLSKTEIQHLVKEIKNVLTLAIQLGGSSLRDYKHVNEDTGKFQTIHNVYAKSGKKCVKCSSIIQEIRLGQRNSFYCPICQK